MVYNVFNGFDVNLQDSRSFLFDNLKHYDMKTLKLIATAIGFFLLLLMAAAGDSEPSRVFAFLPFAVLFIWAGDGFRNNNKA